MLVFFTICLSWEIVFGILTESQLPKEIGLRRQLLKYYDPTVRPVLNTSDPVNVTVGLALQQIIETDEKKQILKATFWLRLYWTDSFLRWNESEFDGITGVKMSAGDIWVPDICVYNGLEAAVYAGSMQDFLLHVNSDGSIVWLSPVVIESVCHYNVRFFPFDTQYCSVEIGSWAYHGWDIDMFNRSAQGDSTVFRNNVEWEILDFPAVRTVTIYGCCPQPYPFIKYTMVLQRSAGYYVTYLYTPSVVIIAASLFAFCLPPGSDAKIDLAVTGLLSQTVFLLLISDLMPPDALNPPLLGKCLSILLCLQAAAVVMNVLVKRMHDDSIHKTTPPNQYVMKAMHYLKYPFLLTHLNYLPEEDKCSEELQGYDNPESVMCEETFSDSYAGHGKPDVRQDNLSEHSRNANGNGHMKRNGKCSDELTTTNLPAYKPGLSSADSASIESLPRIGGDSELIQVIQAILKDMNKMIDEQKSIVKQKVIAEQWRNIAAMIDRILLYAFLVGVLSISVWFVTLKPDEETQRLN